MGHEHQGLRIIDHHNLWAIGDRPGTLRQALADLFDSLTFETFKPSLDTGCLNQFEMEKEISIANLLHAALGDLIDSAHVKNLIMTF